MGTHKLGKSKNGKLMHYSVGALIEKDGKYLLIERAIYPPGYAGPAGHIDEGETPEQALPREVWEETKLEVEDHKLLFEEELDWNKCVQGIDIHHWHLYDCKVSGKMKMNPKEAESIGWYSVDEIKELYEKSKLEEVWEYWFKKLNLI